MIYDTLSTRDGAVRSGAARALCSLVLAYVSLVADH
jgi:hypothetical protein